MKHCGHSIDLPFAGYFGGSGICLILSESFSATDVTYEVSERSAVYCIFRMPSSRLATCIVALVDGNWL